MNIRDDKNSFEFFNTLHNFEVFLVDVPDEQFVSADRRNKSIEKPSAALGEPGSENTREME